MQFTQVISATPHPLDVRDETGARSVVELPHNAEQPIARCGERSVSIIDESAVPEQLKRRCSVETLRSNLGELLSGAWANSGRDVTVEGEPFGRARLFGYRLTVTSGDPATRSRSISAAERVGPRSRSRWSTCLATSSRPNRAGAWGDLLPPWHPASTRSDTKGSAYPPPSVRPNALLADSAGTVREASPRREGE